MNRLLALAALALAAYALAASGARAQSTDTLAVEDGWRSSLTASASANQASFTNWQAGGINAFSVGTLVNGTFDRVVGRLITYQEARFSFALLKQDTLEMRKADDVLRYGITAEVRSSGIFHPSASFTVRTQAVPGFDYAPRAADYPTLPVTPGEKLKVSDFGAPATLAQSVGVAIRPGGGFSGRAGLGLKETVVGISRLRPLYGNAADEAVRLQAGLDALAQFDGPLVRNVRLLSRLTTFQAFNQAGNVAPDVIFENTLALKVNDILQVSFDTATVYDADISADLQLKQVLGVGLSFSLL